MSNNVSEKLPRTAFGELLVAENTPVIQIATQYGQLGNTESFVIGIGSTRAENALFCANTGASAASAGALTTRRALSYRAGQGAAAEFTAMYSAGVAGSWQRAGLLGVTDTLAFGYEGDSFGITYRLNGVSEVQTLQVTTPAAGGENATVTVDGIAYVVPLTAGTVEHNAFEIAQSLNDQVSIWSFDSVDDSVVAISVFSTPAGAFAFSSGTAVANWTQNSVGSHGTVNHIPEADWSEYPLDFDINPDKLTPFKIQYEYLGGGGIDFWIESPETADFELAHRLKLAGTLTTPSLRNPTFKVGWSALNTTNATDLEICGASAAGFIEGKKIATTGSRAFSSETLSVGLTATNIITVKVRTEFGGIRNLAEIGLAIVGLSTDSGKPVVGELIKNADFGGSLTYSHINQNESVVLVATDSVAVTGGEVIASAPLGTINLASLGQTLIPGDTLTIAMRVTQTPESAMGANMIWIEDQ